MTVDINTRVFVREGVALLCHVKQVKDIDRATDLAGTFRSKFSPGVLPRDSNTDSTRNAFTTFALPRVPCCVLTPN